MQHLKYLVLPIVLGIFIISCEKDDSTVVDPILNIPSISNETFTPQTFDSDTINAIATVQVASVDPIKQVSVTIINPNNEGETAVQLKDDGVVPDVTAGDGIYSGRVVHVPACMLVGNWSADFIAETEGGLFSNPITVNFSVTNSNNQPPVISENYIYPDSLSTTDTLFFIFRVKAIDPDGQCDIYRVFYTGLKPDSTQVTPQDLFDDGSCCPIGNTGLPSGDSVTNDTYYTRKFVGFTTLQGYFKYFLKAVDRSGDTSNIIMDSIYVYQ